MSRYIVVEEQKWPETTPIFIVYKKGWLFDKWVGAYITKKDAISFVLETIEKGEKSSRKIVFDSKKDLSLDIHF